MRSSAVSEPTRRMVSVTARPLWRIRLSRGLPRYLLCIVSFAGLAASLRFAIAPPAPVARAEGSYEPAPPDRAAEAYAALFARRYLTWNAAEPQASAHALQGFVGPGMDPMGGLVPPASGHQRVEWVEVVQARAPAAGEHVYTVAAQTDASGLLYLTVSVNRAPGGSLTLAGYPAFVGAPASVPAQLAGRRREVADQALATVVERALRNYLADSPGELAADLTNGARVSPPGLGLSLQSIQRLDWSPAGGSVQAVTQAQDGRGVQYTLAYELDVIRKQDRWEVSAVQMDPDA